MNFTERFLNACIVAKGSGLNCMSHVIVLAYVSMRDNGEHCTKLAEVAKVSTAAITNIVDTLEKMGLVERKRLIEDRRSHKVHITDKGKETIARMLP